MAAKRKTTGTPAKPNSMSVETRQGETDMQAKARVALSPVFNAAIVERSIVTRTVSGVEFSVTDIHSALLDKFRPVVEQNDLSSVETMLLVQANTCDLLFNDMVLRARAADTMPKLEAYMRMALKAQQQCASTLRVLGELKNPKSVAFIRQANVAHGPQQVNNGIPPTGAARAHEEDGVPPNKLLEHDDGEWLESGAAGEAGRGNQAVEAVGTVHGPED